MASRPAARNLARPGLPPPSVKAGAFRKLLLALDPGAFERWLTQWVKACLGLEQEPSKLRGVSLDGKSLDSTLGRHGRGLHLLALLDQQSGCVLGRSSVGSTTKLMLRSWGQRLLPHSHAAPGAIVCCVS